jgi:hypothetical protein
MDRREEEFARRGDDAEVHATLQMLVPLFIQFGPSHCTKEKIREALTIVRSVREIASAPDPIEK